MTPPRTPSILRRLRAAARSPHALPLGLLTLAIVALFAPTFHVYMWYGHERFHPVSRIKALCEVWAAQGPGQAPWLPETCFGQGWPFFTFYSPLAYDIGALFHFIFRLGYGAATRWSFYASAWASGVAMYALVDCGLRIADCRLRNEKTESQISNFKFQIESSSPHSTIRNPQSNISHSALETDAGKRTRASALPVYNPPGALETGAGIADEDVRGPRKIPQSCWWALAAALVYVFAPYHLTDLFARASLAEGWIWAILPLLLLALESARPRPWTGVPWIALAGAALILTHNIFAVYGALLAGAWVLLTARNWRWPLAALSGGLLGAVLSAWFWLPAMTLKKWVPVGDVNFMYGSPDFLLTHAVHWQQFFIERVGMGESIAGWRDQLGIDLGIAVGLGLLLVLAALARPGLGRFERRRIIVLLGFTALALFAASPAMPWKHAPAILRYVQFPWRLLLITTLCGALALGWAGPALERRIYPLALAFLATALGLWGVWHNCLREKIPPMSDKTLPGWIAQEERDMVFVGCQKVEYLPLTARRFLINYKFHQDYPPQQSRIMSTSGPLGLRDYLHRGTAYFYTYAAPAEVKAVIQVFWFPGWSLYLDGEAAPERIGRDTETGYAVLRLPPGEHVAEFKYALSREGRLARWISVAGWAVLAGVVFVRRRRTGGPGGHTRATLAVGQSEGTGLESSTSRSTIR